MIIQVTEEQKKLLDTLANLGWLKMPDGITFGGFDTVSKGIEAGNKTGIASVDRGEREGEGEGEGAGVQILPPPPPPPPPPEAAAPATAASMMTPDDQKKRFARALDWLITWEGTSYENVPGDPGGPTKYGLTWRDDSKEMQGLGVKDLKDLTLEQAGIVYWQKYWQGNLCNEMSPPVAECHFNYGVNVGNFQSVKFMQRALGGLLVDGWYGPKTKEALKKMDTEASKRAVAHDMIAYADRFYQILGERMPQFLKGWMNRNSSLRKFIDTVPV